MWTQVVSKLVWFTGMNFRDLTQNSYEYLNKMKLDLDVSNKVKPGPIV